VTDVPIRVLVADDHAIVREGIRHVLEAVPGITVVAEAATGAEALTQVHAHTPDVALLDITMPEKSGIEVAAELRSMAPAVAVLILSMHDEGEYVLEAFRVGARGYVLKDATPTEMRDAVRAVHAGETFFSPAVAARLTEGLREARERERRQSAVEQLTAREREVLVGIADGRTNKEIATRLGISPRTVESHRERLMKKLGIRTVAGLTKLVLESDAPPE
jgi:RNA polymerase sigma factor (sigma-70 family)